MDEVVELVVVIAMSPRSSKTESGCKSYNHFRIDVFSQARNSAPEARISGGRKFHNFRPYEIVLSSFSRAVVQPSVRGGRNFIRGGGNSAPEAGISGLKFL
jgi:hypothetical protein